MEYEFNEEKSNEIINRLKELGAVRSCPRCDNKDFSLHEELGMTPVQKKLKGIELGRSIPTALVICKKCGFISQHALAVIDKDAFFKSQEEK